MVFRSPGLLSYLLLSMLFLLAQCETGVERAEKHYQSGLELAEAGDVDRALVEFRNVFKLNEKHEAARETYARLQRDRGNFRDSYAQYIRLVELYPNNINGRRSLGEMSMKQMNWDAAERHVRAGFKLAPDDIMLKAMDNALNYREAIVENDEDGLKDTFLISQTILADNHDNQVSRRVVIDQLLRNKNFTGALNELENAINLEPDNLEYHELKLSALGALGNREAIGDHLESMFKQFPENKRVSNVLMSWYIQRGELEKAESFLRQLAKDNVESADEINSAIVQFLQRTKGPEAARAELETLIAEGSNNSLYRALRAVLDYESGDREQAVLDLESILKESEPSDQTNNLKVTLAQIRQTSGNHIGARSLVEEVLTDDPGNTDALKMRASWLIQDDKAGEAITTLRTALDQSPRDVSILTLMAQAYLRDGSRQLAGETLLLAVEASNSAVAASLNYAEFLIEDKQLLPAENILINALRKAPKNTQILKVLSDIYLDQEDWGRTEGIIQQLGRVDTPEATNTANLIRTNLLTRQGRGEESIAFLQQLIDQGSASMAAAATIVQTHLRNNEPERARIYVESALEKAPDEPILQFLRAGLHNHAGEIDKAETIYRALLIDNPGSVRLIRTYYGMLRRYNRPEDAAAVLDAGIAASNEVADLMWIKAGEYEGKKQFDDAIAIYEKLYAKDSNSLIIANNLASLITTHRDSAEELERAFNIARRLRGTSVPAFQDTYGWIEYRRGNFEDALGYLESAANGLPNDPLTQYHLGMTYAALERADEARKQLNLALEIAGDSSLPQFDTARKTLDGLGSE